MDFLIVMVVVVVAPMVGASVAVYLEYLKDRNSHEIPP